MTAPMFRLPALPFLLAAAAIAQAPQTAAAETLIEEATRFTVKLRVSVEHPFGSDWKGTSSGTGFVVDKARGWILTNAHVARRYRSKIQANFKDRPPVNASKVYVDSHLDLAVVQVPVAELPADVGEARLGCEDEPPPGLQVVAFGHPFSLDFTATRGIVSGRSFMTTGEAIHTDAAINPGNSGGTLIDEASRKVIGINRANYGNDRGTIGVAIPARLACTILDLLRQGKDPAPPRLPAHFATTSTDGELFVADVRPPWSDKLRIGDRVVAIEGDRTSTYLSRIIDRARGRDTLALTIKRDSMEQHVALKIPPEKEPTVRKGLSVSGLLFAESHGDGVERDVLHVQNVDDASAAELTGFKRGDQILSIDGEPLKSLDAVRGHFAERKGKQSLLIVRRRPASGDTAYTYYLRKLDIAEVQVIE